MKPRVNVDLILVQVRVVHELLQDLHLAAEHLLYLIYLLLTSQTSTDPRLNLRIVDRY